MSSEVAASDDSGVTLETVLPLAGGVGLAVGLLALGAAAGITYAGVMFQAETAANCGGFADLAACNAMAGLEAWAYRLTGLGVAGFVVAFAAEYREQQRGDD